MCLIYLKVIYRYIYFHTFAPLFGPIGGGGGGLATAFSPASAGGGGGGAAASSARTTNFLLGLEKVTKLTREGVLMAAVGRLEASTKLEAAEAKPEVAMIYDKMGTSSSSLSLSSLSLSFQTFNAAALSRRRRSCR